MILEVEDKFASIENENIDATLSQWGTHGHLRNSEIKTLTIFRMFPGIKFP